MGTRGAIARIQGDGFKGVYHHWDSYPDGLGESLVSLAHEHFKGDIKAMLKVLIDEHPAGWSTIVGADFNLTPGWSNDSHNKQPVCYCHGDRHETAQIINQDNAAECDCEYIYAFDEINKTMAILSSLNKDGSKMIGLFGKGNPEAKWDVVKVLKL